MADAKEAKSKSTAVVVWGAVNTFEERTMRHSDWVRLGADAEPVLPNTVWHQGNEWAVPRSQVPLDDAQLAEFLRREPKFSVRG